MLADSAPISSQRAIQVQPGTQTTTRYYGSGTWRESTPNSTQYLDYISTPAGTAGEVMTTVSAGSTVGTAYFVFFNDHQGSVAAIANPLTGAIAEARGYDAWGKMRKTTATAGADDTNLALAQASSEPTGFIGQEYVKSIALVNLNARLYDPEVGRFMSTDPVSGAGGPQGLNPYSYSMNNPLTDADPNGMCGFFQCLGRNIGSFITHAFGKGALPVVMAIVAIVAVVTFQYYVLPALAGELGVTTVVAGDSMASSTLATVSTFSDLSTGLQALDIGLSGAIGGAINTGTLRGALIGAATAEAFWGVGGAKSLITDSGTRFVAGVALHAAVGCASSAAGGGQCGSGALSGGLGEVFTGVSGGVDNKIAQGAIVALGGGTGAALTGGKFGDGFLLAAYGVMYNGWLHDVFDPSGGMLGVGPGGGLGFAAPLLGEFAPFEGAAVLWGEAEASSFFEGAEYTSKVLQQMEGGVGEFHSFPESVTAFENSGSISSMTGGDGAQYQMLRIPGSYQSTGGSWYEGEFQFIKDSIGSINHRLFSPTGPVGP